MAYDPNKRVRLLTAITSVRWFGWGFGELFLPIFILMFSASFFEAGLLSSIYQITFFLTIPFIGILADRIAIKYLIIFSLIIYLFIGAGYLLAGMTGIVLILIITRALNGISYPIYSISRETYFMRNVSKKNESQAFGRFDKIATFWWVIAILIGFLLINYVEIHWLLFAITPTSLICIFLALKMKKDKPKIKKAFVNPYKRIFKEIKKFDGNLRTLSLIIFFFGMMDTIVYFFAPAVNYAQGESILSSAMLIFVYSIPPLFGEKIGKFADKIKYNGYFLSLASLVLVLLVLAFSPNYYLLLASMFVAGFISEFTFLTNMGFMARNSEYKKMGKIDATLSGIASIGAMIGPVLFGLFLDSFSQAQAYFIFIAVTFVMLTFIYKRKRFVNLKT